MLQLLSLPDQTVQHEAGELVRDGGHQGRVLRPREHSCNTTMLSYKGGCDLHTLYLPALWSGITQLHTNCRIKMKSRV